MKVAFVVVSRTEEKRLPDRTCLSNGSSTARLRGAYLPVLKSKMCASSVFRRAIGHCGSSGPPPISGSAMRCTRTRFISVRCAESPAASRGNGSCLASDRKTFKIGQFDARRSRIRRGRPVSSRERHSHAPSSGVGRPGLDQEVSGEVFHSRPPNEESTPAFFPRKPGHICHKLFTSYRYALNSLPARLVTLRGRGFFRNERLKSPHRSKIRFQLPARSQ